tara:strand:- start:10195 stop:13299 length:3105 start_codon:yes stop_codon:yes gene_type:complete
MIPGLPPIRTIARTELTVAASSVTFSGINTLVAALPFTARHLVVIASGRTDRNGGNDAALFQLNGDTGANYAYQYLYADNTTAAAARVTAQSALTSISFAGDTAAAGAFGGGSMLIPHAFNTANHKTALCIAGAADLIQFTTVNQWANVAAITSMKAIPQSGTNFLAGSVFELAVVDEDYAVEEQVLAADGTFTFSDLDDLVQEGDLVGIGYLRTDRAQEDDSLEFSINSDTTASNYARQLLDGGDGSASASSATDRIIGTAVGNNASANMFGPLIASYSAFGKGANDVHYLSLSGQYNQTNSRIRVLSGRRDNIEAVTSLLFNPVTGTNFKSGSMMSLYHAPKRAVDYVELESDTASVTLTVPAGYEDMRLSVYGRSTASGVAVDSIDMIVNGVTGASNYSTQTIHGVNTTVAATRPADDPTIGLLPAATSGANIFGSMTTLIPQYAKTDRHKHYVTVSGSLDSNYIRLQSSRFEQTAAITTLLIKPDNVGDNFAAGSIFILEGIGGVGSELATTKAEYVVEVDWGNDGKFDGTGDDITTSVMSAQWQRGRGSPVTITALSQPGKASVLLLDQAAEYSPLNTGATLFGKLLPGRPMRIRTKTPFPVTEWQGKIDSIQHRPSVDGYHTAIITGIGPFDVVGKAEVNSQIITGTNTGGIVNNVLTEAGWDATAREIDTGQTTPTRYFAGPRKALFSLREMESTEVGFLVEGRSNKIKFEDRYHRMRGKHLESQTTIADDETVSPIRYSALQVHDPSEAIFNQFQAQVVIYSNGAANATLWNHPEAVAGTSAPIIKAGKTIEFFAYFPNRNAGGTETQANDATAIAVGGWVAPTASFDFNVFDTSAATGSIMNTEVIGTLSGTFANAAKMSIQNTGTRDGYLTHAQLRGTAVLASAPVVVEAIDGSSTSTYGLRSMSAQSNAQWIPNTEEAQENVNAKLAAFKDPQAFLQVPYRAELNLNSMHAALKRDISDRITVSGTAAGSFGGDGDYFIESEQHRITADRQHQVSYLVSPVGGLSGWWVVGFSKLGTDTKAGF